MEFARLDLSGRIRVNKQKYQLAVGKNGKDHPDAIMAAMDLGDEYVQRMNMKEAILWYVFSRTVHSNSMSINSTIMMFL
jgi:hypothetical protein